MFNIIYHQENANQNHNKMPLHINETRMTIIKKTDKWVIEYLALIYVIKWSVYVFL